MFLHKTKKKDGRVYLAIMEAYREGKRTRQRTVESLGYLDELEKEHEDPIAHFRAVCEERNAAAAAERQAVPIGLHPMEKIDKRAVGRKNVGSAVLLAVYNAMGVEQALRNATRGKKLGFDLNAVMRLLVCERILSPGSKLSAFNNRDGYFFRTDFGLHDVYRALTELAPLKGRVVSAVNRHVDSLGARDATHVFYDVTNYYFECDPDGDAISEDGAVEPGLRKHGCSKEHRPNPIVQMGLLQDGNGVPIGYELFPGNTNDCSTMLDVLSGMKRDYGVERVIAVADKGLNTATNIAACVGHGDGFVYSQSIRGTKSPAELRNWATSEKGYREAGEGFKVKSRQDVKTVTVEGPDGKEAKVDIEVKVVAFWSLKYQKRARAERAKTVERAREMAGSPAAYGAHASYGAGKYVKETPVDPATGEVGRNVLSFDEGRLAEDEAYDGYYCIVTSETEMPDEEVIEVYRGLWRIEESFRVTKSDLETRPVYVWTRDHIEAHFLTCYVALCVLRLLQLRTGNRYSAGAIATELGKMCGSNVDGNWWLFDHRTDASDDICASVGLDLAKRFMQLQDIKKVLAQANGKQRSTT